MGQFAGTMFRMLLGWVQSAASSLWSLVTNTDVSAWLRYLLDNWLSLVLSICVAGLVIDFIVYLLRWQPYRVWGSFLRRLTEKEEKPAEPAAPLFQRKWVYADGSTQVEDVHEPQEVREESAPLEQPIRPVRRMARRSTPEQSYHQPVYPPHWQDTQEQGENR